ncbi:MAG: hypothetical protein NVS1B9_09010 [Solirubrobacteraceae bacterium]
MDLVLAEETLDGAAGALLVSAFERELARQYPGWHAGIGPSARPADFAPPHGSFVVAYLAGEPAGCAGFKRLDASRAELKRMYVAPQARGHGVARAILRRLEQGARDAGYRWMRLDTGTPQLAARALSESAGDRPIGDYNGNPVADLWFERNLAC